MLDSYSQFWPWLAACLGVGAATGALVSRPTRSGLARWLLWAGLAFLAGGGAVALGAVEGVPRVYLISALACFGAFILGAAALALSWRRSFSAHEGWALGLVPAALLWWGAAHVAQGAYLAQLQKPRTVAESQAPAPAPEQNEKTPDVTATIPPPTAQPEPSPSASQAGLPGDPQSVLASLPSGDLGAAECQRALDAVAALDPVAFRPARATVNRRAALALDKAAEIIRRCRSATIEVRGHGDEAAEEETLSHRRALAAERYLRREGVAGRRLVAVGCCGAYAERRPSAIDFVVR